MKTKSSVILQQPVEDLIRIIRGQRVILDSLILHWSMV